MFDRIQFDLFRYAWMFEHQVLLVLLCMVEFSLVLSAIFICLLLRVLC